MAEKESVNGYLPQFTVDWPIPFKKKDKAQEDLAEKIAAFREIFPDAIISESMWE